MECDRHNFLWFWVICCTFTPLLMPKIKIWKKTLDILSFYTCVPINEDHMIYGSWDIRHDGQSLIVILGHFWHFDPPNNLKIKILKKKKNKNKNSWRYYHFTLVYHKWQLYDVWFLIQSAIVRIFYHFVLFFVLLPPRNPENQNVEKKEKNTVWDKFAREQGKL